MTFHRAVSPDIYLFSYRPQKMLRLSQPPLQTRRGYLQRIIIMIPGQKTGSPDAELMVRALGSIDKDPQYPVVTAAGDLHIHNLCPRQSSCQDSLYISN